VHCGTVNTQCYFDLAKMMGYPINTPRTNCISDHYYAMTEQNQSAIQQADDGKPYLPVWGPWQTTGLGLAIFAINAAAQAGVFLVFVAKEYASNPGPGILKLITGLTTNGLVLSLSVIAGAAVGVPMIIVFVKVCRRASIREYLALNPITKKQVLVSLAIVAGLTALIELVGSATGQSSDTFTVNAYQTAKPLALLWISIIIFGPVFEETFFRGFLFAGWVRSRLGSVGAIALTSSLFALLHIQYDLFGIISVLVMGIALGIMRLKTGSLWSPLLMHFIWNLVGMVMLAINLGNSGS
jgi:membrane protease YdiL (CAAX protease family)